MAASPDGRSLYVADFTTGFAGGQISQYDVRPRGKLSPKSPHAVAGAKQLLNMAGFVSLGDGFKAEERMIRSLIGSANLASRRPVFEQ